MIEAGAWRGGASILARATLDSLGADERTVWVADSFEGLPAPDPEFPEDRGLDLSQIDFLAVPPDGGATHFARFGCEQGVELVRGLVRRDAAEPSRASLGGRPPRRRHLRGDLGGARVLYPGLSAGGYLIVDDYVLIEECRRAVDEFRSQHGITEPIEKVDWNGIRWRRESEPVPTAAGEGPVRRTGRERGSTPPAMARPPIPTRRELELERELADSASGSARARTI